MQLFVLVCGSVAVLVLVAFHCCQLWPCCRCCGSVVPAVAVVLFTLCCYSVYALLLFCLRSVAVLPCMVVALPAVAVVVGVSSATVPTLPVCLYGGSVASCSCGRCCCCGSVIGNSQMWSCGRVQLFVCCCVVLLLCVVLLCQRCPCWFCCGLYCCRCGFAVPVVVVAVAVVLSSATVRCGIVAAYGCRCGSVVPALAVVLLLFC